MFIMASVTPSFTFKEFCPLYYLLNAIPTKIQKGFRSIVVYLTALDTNGDYIAVGSSIGMLYLYCRHLNQMKKYNLEGKSESITVVKLLSCFDDLVAVGTASGKISVFQLVSSLPGRNKQLRRFNVSGVHKSSITALAWSPNGMKLFSGDDKGKIVYSALDLDQGRCSSSLILEEPSSVVQLDYSQKVLLVSTLQRSLLFYTEEKLVKQVGAQPRKNTGKFGACFIPGLCKQSDLTLFAVRPGIRLWKSDIHGTVQATFILKDVFAAGVKPFELYPRVEHSDKRSCNFPERQLGLISCFFQEGWVLSWNEYSIYLLDTVNQAMIGSLEGSGDIVSVSCTENEIFLLKGDRDIIRISSRPEGLVSIDMNSKLMSPLSDLSPKLQSPHSVIASVSSDLSPEANQRLSSFPSPQTRVDKNGSVARTELEIALLTERIRSQSFDGLGDLSTDPRRRGYSVASEPRSRSSSMNSVDSGSSFMTSGDQTSSEAQREGQLSSQRFSVISSEDFNQELIVKPIKVKKKKKKRPENGTRRNPSSLESMPCYERQGSTDSPQSANADLLSVNSSLMSSIADRFSLGSVDQESVFSGESQSVVQEENGSETFSVPQSPESIADLTPEGNGGAPELLKFSDGENEVGASSASTSHLVDVEDEVGSKETQQSPHLKQTDSNLEQPPPNGADYSALCKTEDTLDISGLQRTLDALEEAFPVNGASVKVYAEEICGWNTGTETHPEQKQHQPPMDTVPKNLIDQPPVLSKREVCHPDTALPGQAFREALYGKCNTDTFNELVSNTHNAIAERSASSDEEDIYGHGLPYSSSETSVTEMGIKAEHEKVRTNMEEGVLLKSDQFAESWMGYAGPGYGILSLVVSDKYIWCLDYKGGLYCSALPSAGLRWQRFEENVQQVAVSPSGTLLWKVEQKTNKAFACGKVTIKGKRHWYEALPQTVFVSLSDDTAWIIRTNGDLYLQTGLSVDRPCARAVKVDCPYPLSQVTAKNNVVWALTEQRALLYREGVSSFCPEGEQWKCDIVSEMQALEPVCVTLGDQQTVWVLDIHGNLWFRTGVVSKKPQGEDNHWWQVSITDYVVFDQSSLFQTIIQATQTVATVAQAPVEKVADKLRTAFWSQQLQCQPSLLAVSSSGVWISSGKNEFHVAKGSLIGTYWNNVVPRGTASAIKWAFVLASTAPTKEGSFLWLRQSNKDLFCVSDQNSQFHPSTVQLPPDGEMVYYSACQDAIWALDNLGQVFIRTLSPNCPTGMHWTKLDLAQLGAVKLVSLACGNQHIWACDSCGGIYFRVGTQPLNPSLMLPAWIMIEPPIQPVGVNLIGVYSSPNDQSLWTIDSKGNIHVRSGITEEMPVGTDWEQVPGLQACQLVISTRTVWARCPNGDVARRYGITDKNPAGDYWKKIPGNVTCLTVTPLDELWAIGASGYLLQRLTKTFHHSHTLQKHADASVFHSDDFEDEWEVI
ncbi:tectonin beta-propeller repeat-containing protein 2 [Hemicordylus capensis]|uniref:tectonin beta-propeller repeat-containing protein 2 n=1 Tax=Hemicordylus capensis TaxID=884348 RepID=UPI002304CAFD|nr:tectonin beta-propeller repeat-containing protein 2 [Hemicordylus capensis]XP_053156352.1 tectonin beta-propeller repeat-containing protein 2 [Hemicordylus capensis]XP_053156361.1 tectonin beta-propeller repeat-containing protein 2 [Hemicordylus capensis]XP_053156370.1 tectonin beta-propeller repeat-containing protein 2 [Hemicordylus capensis]XP_053156378.1 tectonin beta-propeller repeat-containing protein 2 [Hemicordylus capensis]